MTQQEPEEKNDGIDATVEDIEDVKELKEVLIEEKEKATNYLDNWQRTQADFVNYKRRSEQEKEEIRKFANSVLILSFLSVLDDLERAVVLVPPEIGEVSWVEGVKLIERRLRTSMEAQGLSNIKALGEVFDPNLHEAVRQGNGEEGVVIEEVQRGYTFHDRILRPSKVVVGNGEMEETKKTVRRTRG